MNKYTKAYSIILDNMDLQQYRIRPTAVIMYLQDAFARYTATKKMAAYDLFAYNLYWVVAEFNIEFVDKLPFWSEEIKIELWFSEISKLKIYIDFNIYYKDRVFSKGNALWFLIDSKSKRPVKTDILQEKFTAHNEFVLGEHKKFVLPPLIEKTKEITHTTNLSDIDFNNHVNNKSYINIAEMATTKEFKQTHELKNMHITFNKETFLGDCLNCTAYKTDSQDSFVYVIKKDENSVCNILTSWIKTDNSSINITDYDLDVKSELQI